MELGNGALPLYTSMPQGEVRDGEYPVNYSGAVRKVSGGRERSYRKGSVLNAFAPCLIHTLDAAFAGHVIEALDAQDVRDIVAINDCFLVPSDALPTLRIATKAAGRGSCRWGRSTTSSSTTSVTTRSTARGSADGARSGSGAWTPATTGRSCS